VEKYNSPPLLSENLWWLRLVTSWTFLDFVEIESLITNLQVYLYTTKLCHYDGKINKKSPYKQSFYYKSFICKVSLAQGQIFCQDQIFCQGQISGQGQILGQGQIKQARQVKIKDLKRGQVWPGLKKIPLISRISIKYRISLLAGRENVILYSILKRLARFEKKSRSFHKFRLNIKHHRFVELLKWQHFE